MERVGKLKQSSTVTKESLHLLRIMLQMTTSTSHFKDDNKVTESSKNRLKSISKFVIFFQNS